MYFSLIVDPFAKCGLFLFRWFYMNIYLYVYVYLVFKILTSIKYHECRKWSGWSSFNLTDLCWINIIGIFQQEKLLKG